MTCEQAQVLGADFDTERATLAETAALARHLLSCPSCMEWALAVGDDLPVRERWDAIRRADRKIDEVVEAMKHDPEL